MCDLNLLKALCMSNGISGHEHNVREIIIREISEYVDELKVDNLGNIIAFKKGKLTPKKRLMLCSHMDEVGFIVTYINNEGYLQFQNVGGIDSHIIHGINVLVGDKCIPGVIGVSPTHMLSKSEKLQPGVSENLLIDIGAKDKENALNYVNIGDPVYFDSEFMEFQEKIRAKALDDRAGCAILIEILKTDIPYDAHFVFTVQEEVGLRGAQTAAYNVNADCAIIVEATTAYDVPGVAEGKQICKIGNGPAISFMDRATVYNKEYFNLAIDTAKNNDIKFQFKKGVSGGNDSGAIHLSRGGVRTVAVSLPCRYLHSPWSMISLSDYKYAKQFVYLLMDRILQK